MKTHGFLQRRPSAAEVARLVTRRPTAGEIGNAFPALRRSTFDARRSGIQLFTRQFRKDARTWRRVLFAPLGHRQNSLLDTRTVEIECARVRARTLRHVGHPLERIALSEDACFRAERERGGRGWKETSNIGRIDGSQYDARSSSRDYRTIDPSAQSMQMHIMLLSSA